MVVAHTRDGLSPGLRNNEDSVFVFKELIVKQGRNDD